MLYAPDQGNACVGKTVNKNIASPCGVIINNKSAYVKTTADNKK